MTIKPEDMKLWEDFKARFERTKSIKSGTISEVGKRLIKLVKTNMKNRSNEEINDEYLPDSYKNFELQKDKSLGIDGNSDRKLRRGKYKIDCKLDLHGSTLDEAYNRIKNLFKIAAANNYKCLLIITGKGLHSKNRTIKNSISDWFKEPYFSSRIVEYTDASVEHGGSGAVYVLLRNKQ